MMHILFFLGVLTLSSAQTIIKLSKPNFNEDFRIVNGKEATPHSYPFIARLTVIWGNEAGLCGGTILNQNFVVTAAHCFFHPETGQMAGSVILNLGDHTISSKDPNEQEVWATQFYMHDYDQSSHYNDIAIIELNDPVSFNSHIQPGCIVTANSNNVGTSATAAGWGALGSGKPTSDVLREAPIPVLDDSVCKNSYGRGFYSEVMVCGGYTDGSKDTCQGDSGGPLFYSKNGKYTVIGLTSFGRGCAMKGYPGVYTRVATFTNWVKQVVGQVCVN